jgi:hypothetical protein
MKHQGDHAKDQRCFFGSHLIERCELVMVTQDRIKRPKGKLKGEGNRSYMKKRTVKKYKLRSGTY